MLSVRDLMTASPETVTPDVTLHDVLARMNGLGCRHLPVCEDGKLVGIVTDRDVRLAVNSPILSEEARLPRTAVLEELVAEDCMTREPLSVASDLSAAAAADLLALHGYGALPVVDDGTLVGILSTTDYLRHFASTG